APVLQMLERMKQELVPVGSLRAWASSTDDADKAALMRACVRLFHAYERECHQQRFLDFDDLVLLAVRLLERKPEVRRRYAGRYPHVLVDEYQDLNLAQERLVELVAGAGDPFVVGDDDQSIYRFRGASRASLERFLGSFPMARTVTLGRNRRSSRRIVSAASALIANNLDRLPKQLRAEAGGPGVQAWEAADGNSEARAIAREAARLVEDGTALSSIAVLCRTNAIARPIATALAAEGLPHVVIGGHGFLDRPEVKDLIALLRLVRDPADLVALARVDARPATALMPSLVARFSEAADRLDVRDLFFELMEQTGYLAQLRAGLEASEAARATANVRRFAEMLAEVCESPPDRSLGANMRHLDRVPPSAEHAQLARVAAMDGGRGWREPRVLSEVRAVGAGAILEKQTPPTPQAVPPIAVNGRSGEVQLSYSAITSYLDCPRQYWYRHLQHLPVVQSAEAVHGVILHEVLRRAGEVRREGRSVSGPRLRSIHNDVWKETSFPDPRRIPAFLRNGAADLEAYRARGG